MSKHFSIDTIDEFFYTQKQNKSFSNELNDIEVIKKDIDKNITLFKGSKSVDKKITIPIKYNPEGLIISIVLEGGIHYKSAITPYESKIRKNETELNLINKEEGTNLLLEDTDLKSVMLLLKGDFLDTYLLNKLKEQDSIKKNYERSRSKLLLRKKTNTATALLASEIYNSPFTGELNHIFLQGKAYDIIYNEFKVLLDQEKHINSEYIKFSKEDMEALHYAKKLIKEDQKYLSLKELSRAVALNEFKLKYGFKKLFNTSVGTMILNEKMEQSKVMLQSGELSISEISQIVGYKYYSSFTTAFKKHFGTTPSEIMKNRKYYY